MTRQGRRILVLAPPPATGNRYGVAHEDAAAGLAEAGLGEAGLAHDARNLISALDLYCDLLASPGVLAPGFHHYADDLRLVAGNGARLIEALAGSRTRPVSRHSRALTIDHTPLCRRPFPGIEDLASELCALEAPLRALAGADVRLEVECAPCAGRLALNPEDLFRILFNLVANAVEAMASTAAELRRNPVLRITAQRGGGVSFLGRGKQSDAGRSGPETVLLSVRDNGPGIAAEHVHHIFDAGFSTRPGQRSLPPEAPGSIEFPGTESDGDDETPHGLGLTIVRQLVTAAGGAVRAVSPPGLGARFDIELPILGPEARIEAARLREKRQTRDLQQISAQIEKEA